MPISLLTFYNIFACSEFLFLMYKYNVIIFALESLDVILIKKEAFVGKKK